MIFMKKLFSCLLLTCILSGCATQQPSVPVTYAGPTAVIKDSVKSLTDSKGYFYYVEMVDDARVENSRIRTLTENRGRGMRMTPAVVERKVAARPLRLAVVGRTEYAAPIQALKGVVYQVKGVVQFTPEANKSYTVRGDLGENSSVWVEDDETGTIVGAKVEQRGAQLGFFEK